MGKGRTEAMSDGVIAIIITIMVLEMKVPDGDTLQSLAGLFPVFISYILSFINIGIYWNNHHHMMHAVQHVNGKVLWTNLHLLFWLSLVPFATAWMGENNFATIPVALYCLVLLCAALAYSLLAHTLIQLHGKNSTLAIAVGKGRKGSVSVVLYFLGFCAAFISTAVSLALVALVAAIWFIPDRRIEKNLPDENETEEIHLKQVSKF